MFLLIIEKTEIASLNLSCFGGLKVSLHLYEQSFLIL